MPSLEDRSTTLADLKARIEAFAIERDWLQFHTPKNLSMALAAEAAELMEHYLWLEGPAARSLPADGAKRRKVADELADIVIYALEFANVTGLDVAAAVEAKMAANAAKYPADKSRGRAVKYDEL